MASITTYKLKAMIVCYQMWKSVYLADSLLWEGIGWMDGDTYSPVYIGFTLGDYITVVTPMAAWRIKKKPKKK